MIASRYQLIEDCWVTSSESRTSCGGRERTSAGSRVAVWAASSSVTSSSASRPPSVKIFSPL